MLRAKTLGLALVAVFAMGAVGVLSASAAPGEKNGPHWWVCKKSEKGKFSNSECSKEGTGWESKELLKGENRPIKFTSGETKLITKAHTIVCKKDNGTGEIIGGWPGTDKAKIKFEECEEPALKCKVKNEGQKTEGVIEVAVNTELVYFTEKAGNEEKPPLGILFKTIAKGNKTFVKLIFSGLCSLVNGPVTATGEEQGPGIEGVAGVVCKIVEPAEAYKFVHEIECKEKEQENFCFWKAGVLTKGKAGLEFNGEKAEQVGNAKIEAENAAKEKVAFDARGT